MKLSEIIKEMEDEYYVAKNNKYWQKIEFIEYYLPLLKALNDEDWVSVEEKDKLPAQGKRVLIYTSSGMIDKGYRIGGLWERDCPGQNYDELGYTITHHRPLPTPPNIENSNQ